MSAAVADDEASPVVDEVPLTSLALGRLLTVGVAQCRAFGGWAVNYSELPQAMTGRLAAFFALDIEQCKQVLTAAGQHAKQPSQVFVGDSDDKRREASVLLNERIQQWALEPYEALEQLRKK